MDNAQGKKIYYGITLDNAQLRQDAEQSKNIFRGIGDASAASASRIDNAYKSVSGTLVKLGAAVSAVELAKGIYNFADRFERSMAEVTTISQTVTNNLGKFKQEIIEMSTEIPVPADEAAKALYQIVSAGHDGAAGLEVLRISAKAAVGGVTETVTAADAITSILNAYKKGAGEAEHISDQLFTTVRLGKTTMGELGHSISQAIPIAAAFGIESEQVLAAIATLTKSGTPTAQAVTQIRAAINAASKALGDGYFKTHTFQEGLQAIADKAGGSEAELRKNVTEIEAINAILGLTGINAKTAASDLEQLMNSAGATEAAFRKMVGETNYQLIILKNNVLAEFSELGERMVDNVGVVASALNEAFDTGKIDKLLSVLASLIAMYGTYKATLVATAAIRKSVETVKHTEEAAELYKLLTAEQQAKISKLGLSKASTDYAMAVRMEVAAEMERQTKLAVATNEEITAARVRLGLAEKEKATIAEKVAAREAELGAAVASGNAKKIEAAQTRLNTAQEQLNTASVNVNTAAREVNSKRAQLDTAVRRANTLETGMNTAAQNANAKATGFLSVAKERLRAATVKLNAVIKKNGFALAATAAVALGYGLYKLITYQTDAEKAQKRLNEATDEFEMVSTSEIAVLNIMFSRLNKAKEGTDEYRAAKDAIQKKYGDYLSSMDNEVRLLKDTALAQKELTTAILETARARAQEKFIQQESDAASEKQVAALRQIREKLIKEKGKDVGETIYGQIKSMLVAYQNDPQDRDGKKYTEYVRLLRENGLGKEIGYGRLFTSAYTEYVSSVQGLMKAQRDAEAFFGAPQQLNGADQISSDGGQTTFDASAASLQQLMDRLPKAKEELAALKKAETPDPAAIAAKEQEIAQIKDKTLARERELSVIKEVKAQIETLQKEQLNYSKDDEEYKALDTRIKALKTKLPGTGSQQSKAENEYNKIVLAARERLASAEIDLERNKIEDKADLIEFDRKQTVAAIEKMREEALAAWKALGNDDNSFDDSVFQSLIDTANLQAAFDTDNIFAERAKNEKEELDALLQQFRTYEQQRTEIARKFDEDRAAIEKSDASQSDKEAALSVLEKRRKEAIKAVNDEEIASMQNSADVLVSLFEDASNKSVSEILKITETAEQLMSYLADTKPADITPKFGFTAAQLRTLKDSPKEIEAISDGIKKLNAEAVKKNPFATLAKNLKDLFAAGTSDDKTEKKLSELGESAAASADRIGGLAGSLSDMFAAMGNNELAGAMDTIQGIMSAVSNIGEGFAKGGIVGGVFAAAGELAKGISKIFQAEARHREALKAIQKEQITQQREYNALLHDAVMETSESLFGERKLLDAKKYYAEAQKQQDLLNAKMGNLTNGRVVTGHKKTGLFGWGKGEDVYSSLLSVYPKLIDQNGKFDASIAQAILNTRKLDDDTARMLSDLIQYSEQAEEAMDALNDIAGEVVGNMASTMTEAIFNAIETGADGWDAFQDSGADAIKALGKMMVQELIVSNYLDKYSDDIAEMLGQGDKEGVMDLFGRIATEMPGIYEMAADATQQIYDAAARAGYDMTGSAERQASSKGITTASQESVNEGNGRLTMIQGLAFDIREAVNAIAASKTQDLMKIEINTERLHSIDANVFGIREASNLLVANSARMLQHLAGIEDNTSNLHAMREDLSSIRNELRAELSSVRHTVGNIADKGLILKRR